MLSSNSLRLGVRAMQENSENHQNFEETAPELPAGWLRRWPWATFLLPLLVFMLVGELEPSPPDPEWGETPGRFGITYADYPTVYSIKIALTTLAMLVVLPGYRTLAWRFSPLAVVVGLLGGPLWVGICRLQLEARLLGQLGWESALEAGQRSAFNPLVELADQPAWAFAFLAIRLFGLVIVVGVIEEFFLRGLIVRYFVDVDWWRVPIGQVTPAALVAGTAVPMLMHPGELLAALVWFSLVSWLMVRTRNLWDCVMAHMLTNLVLGLWVLYSGDWWLM